MKSVSIESILYGLSVGLCVAGIAILKRKSDYNKLVEKFGRPLTLSSGKLLGSQRPDYGSSYSNSKLVVFFDYQCEPCRREWKPLVAWANRYKAAIYLRHFPLSDMHDLAFDAAAVSAEAKLSGAGWRVHSTLMTKPLSRTLLRQFEREFGHNKVLKASEDVRRDISFAKRLGINHTPTIFLIEDESVFQVNDATQLY